eukprot:TRINITY_DN17072_c0_g1_i1.p1 TRINITY_DN17072_c0_g1~~TRINITY_DN17072_c0_g1_i1.p1  ORF type:complete len:367 (-),score=53.42 TRINITY_DN17072_c0_g1_i1:274-1374(-)
MGLLFSFYGHMHRVLEWHEIPDSRRETYFPKKIMRDWHEILVVPTTSGCTISMFEDRNPSGGEAIYKVQNVLSHSEYVPRYQVHVVDGEKTTSWIVGHMEMTNSDLRAKPGEFVRVQCWTLTCNSMVLEHKRGPLSTTIRILPSATDMLTMGVTIALHSKLLKTDVDGKPLETPEERWVQKIGVSDKAYEVHVHSPVPYQKDGSKKYKFHKELKSMNSMVVKYHGKKVAIVRKQRFDGPLGSLDQPFIGIQIDPSFDSSGNPKESTMRTVLGIRALMTLLLSLVWCEDSLAPPTNTFNRFVKAMHEKSGSSGFSSTWDMNNIKNRLKHLPYACVHDWPTRKDGSLIDEMASSSSESSASEDEDDVA